MNTEELAGLQPIAIDVEWMRAIQGFDGPRNLPQKPPMFPRRVPISSGLTSVSSVSEYVPWVRVMCR